jgi:hypothetical protein
MAFENIWLFEKIWPNSESSENVLSLGNDAQNPVPNEIEMSRDEKSLNSQNRMERISVIEFSDLQNGFVILNER